MEYWVATYIVDHFLQHHLLKWVHFFTNPPDEPKQHVKFPNHKGYYFYVCEATEYYAKQMRLAFTPTQVCT